MAVNAYGAVQVQDFGNPKVISGYAREVISGGQFVTGSTAAGVVSSGADSLVTSDLKFYVNGSGNLFNGIALNTAVSGALVAVATEGVFLLQAIGTVTAGENVAAGGDSSVLGFTRAGSQAAVNLGSGAEFAVGRALTGAASGGFVAVHIKA